jgi:O-antigen/teichoic acid export membrane protein
VFVSAIGLVTFFCNLSRAGVDTYLVRREIAPDRELYQVALTLILTIAGSLFVLGATLIPLLTRWYGSSEFVLPYLLLLVTVPITGVIGAPMAELERRLDFTTAAAIELRGQGLSTVLSSLLAWSGLGVWAPVWGLITGQIYVLLRTFSVTQLTPRLVWHTGHAREMLAFGIPLTASLRTWQLRTLVNPLIVGRVAGPEGVAFVGLTLRVAEALGTIRIAAARIAIAALARLQTRPAEFRRALQQGILFQVVTLGPLLCAFSLLGPWIVAHLLGARWAPSLAVFPFVAAGVLINSVFNLQASALFVLGRQWTVTQSYVAHVLVLTITALLCVPRAGIVGYGWAELLACGACLPIHAEISRLTHISYRTFAPWLAFFLLIIFAASR